MKQRLLKPPPSDGEIIFIPELEKFLAAADKSGAIGLVHQPYFFNPGVSLKFIFLEELPFKRKEIIFLDTDRIGLTLKIPTARGAKMITFINEDCVLCNYLTPNKTEFGSFFDAIEDELKEISWPNSDKIIANFLVFKNIILKNSKRKLLKEVLAESFLEFYDIKQNYQFLSDLIAGQEFREFLENIFEDDVRFREVFNQALDEYHGKFKFRFKNFPYPKLLDDELPFWMVKNARRERLFKNRINREDLKHLVIFPRAYTLTIFLRRYRLNFLIHGIGGGNYEWVQDRIIERFFNQRPSKYAVISGTFLIDGYSDREFPYFLFSPKRIRKRVHDFMTHNDVPPCKKRQNSILQF